jgi:hypothetical protein
MYYRTGFSFTTKLPQLMRQLLLTTKTNDMKSNLVCQSCGMPIDKTELRGTEKDGSKSEEYCKYCFQQGAFTEGHKTFEEMETRIVDQMSQQKMSQKQVDEAVDKLFTLKRWRTTPIKE